MRQTNLRWGTVALVLACASPAARASAEERWLEVRSPHFRVLTDASEQEGRAVATGFEQLRKLFAALGDLRVDPPAPIVVVVTRNEAGLRALLPSRWERRGGKGLSGVFLAGTSKHHIALRLDVDADYRDDIVYHEYAHLIARLNFAALPVWLSEGLAEFYASTTVYDGTVLFGRVGENALEVLRLSRPLPLEDLFAIDRTSRAYNEQSRATILYAQSALLAHYFLVGDEGAHRHLLTEYLRLLGQGTPELQARALAFGDLKTLQRDFSRYARQPRFVFLSTPLERSDAPAAARPLTEAEVLALRGEFHARLGLDAEARPLLARARDRDPKLAAVPQTLGLIEFQRGRPAEARRQLAEAIRLGSDDFASHYLWARAMPSDAPDLPATEAALRRALELNPSFAPAHALLGSVLRRQGQLDPALLSVSKACELEPTRAVYRVERAELLRELKRPAIADEIETQLVESTPSDPEQLRMLAEYYHSENRRDELERLLRKSAQLNPRSSVAPLLLARILREAGRADDAEAAYRSALTAQPDNPQVLNQLAYFNADRNAKLPEALELIDRALKMLPKNAMMLDTKGWVLFRLGRLEDSERYLRQSLEQRESFVVLEHLGDVLAARGQKAAAQEMWKRALDHPDVADARREELRRKLGG